MRDCQWWDCCLVFLEPLWVFPWRALELKNLLVLLWMEWSWACLGAQLAELWLAALWLDPVLWVRNSEFQEALLALE